MMVHQVGSPANKSGTILQNALGKSPLSRFLMAWCTSSFEAETPRCEYRSEVKLATISFSLLPSNWSVYPLDRYCGTDYCGSLRLHSFVLWAHIFLFQNLHPGSQSLPWTSERT